MDKIKQWAKAAGMRAIKSAAQGAILLIGTTAVTLDEVSWAVVASGAALMVVLSLLTSLAGIPEVDAGASIAQIAKEG